MLVETMRFGPIEIQQEQITQFPDGLPGLESLRRFVIIRDERIEPLAWLQAIDDAAIALPIASVFDIMEDYVLDISDDDVERLKIESAEDVLVFVVVIIPEEVHRMTANLAAPIVINTKQGLARQLLTNTADYSVQQPIFQAIMRTLQRRDEDAGTVTQGE